MENYDWLPSCLLIFLVQGESDQLPSGTRIVVPLLHRFT